MFQVKQNNTLATYFPALHSRNKHNYQTRSTTHNLLRVPLLRTKKFGKESVKYQYIRDWNNFERKFPQIPENNLSYMKIKRILKQVTFWSILNILFTTINFYMCTLYYFCFFSPRVVQLTSYFIILLVLILIVNWNFKLLNWHNILLCYYRLCCFYLLSAVVSFFMFLLFVLLLSFDYYCCCYYLFITIFIYSFISLFTYFSYFIYLFILWSWLV